MKNIDLTALFKIEYGLYAVTSKIGEKDNALIVNTVSQVTNTPARVVVTIDKKNYSHDIIKETGILNVNCLSVRTPFEIYEKFGFHSGKDTDKLSDIAFFRTENGLCCLSDYINAYISLKVFEYVDLGTHGMFICDVTEANVISDEETMTYFYYFKNVKPKPETKNKKGFVCKICGFIYEGDTLPDDFICPICKHPASDFEQIK